MNLLFWLALLTFLLTLFLVLELAIGMRRIGNLADVAPLQGDHAPKVSIIVAALNEADTITPALRSLLALDYPNLEIIAVNDRSTDATPAIMNGLAAEYRGLRVLHVETLPPGWLGKNHALHHGAALASGDYLLFTDADVLFAPDALRRAVAYCEHEQVDHLALFFEQRANSALLRLLLTSFCMSFMARFKPWKVAGSSSHFIGIGAFNLVRRETYARSGGHAALPMAVIDDLLLGKRLKMQGCRQRVLFGIGLVSVEWYPDTPALVRGLEKNIFAAFDYQLWRLVLFSVAMLVFRLWPWLATLLTSGPVRWMNVATVAVSMLLVADILRMATWGWRPLLFMPLASLIELIIWWRGSLLTLLRDGVSWRGTHYSLEALKQGHQQAQRNS